MIVSLFLKLIILEVIYINLSNFEQNVRKFSCAYKIVDVWNSLNNHVVAMLHALSLTVLLKILKTSI